MWGEIDPAKYEDAYYNYTRLRDQYGWLPFIIERMMKYYIRTNNLKEVLPLREWFDADPRKRPLSAETLAELGGYLLDKQEEEVKGVPNEYVEKIKGVRDILFRAIEADKYEIIGDNLVPSLPEPHYHLARYYHNLGNTHEERNCLEVAIRAFDNAREESIKRLNYRIDSHQRLADLLINEGEFLPAEENLIKGVNLYEDAVSRRLISRTSTSKDPFQYGKLYAGLGDLEYFTKTGDMETALKRYKEAEQHGWSPPEMKYRMGAAHYQLEDWRNALEYLFNASSELPQNRRVLYALGNAALKRGDYFAAQGYYNRLLALLERQRVRLPLLLPQDSPEYLELAERLMMAFNNAGVANEMLAAQTGNRDYMNRAMTLYTDSSLAWDSLTRNPESMIRSSSISYPRQNMQNTLYPQTGYEPRIYIRIDRDAPDSSKWEKLTSLSWFRNQTGENN
jgi:tetratricopeptide (TPR) repeat protein